MRIGILTGGGDCPGLNAVIYGILLQAQKYGHEIVGIARGWHGVVNNITIPLDLTKLDDLHIEGGTILFTSRTNPLKGIRKDDKEGMTKAVKDLVDQFPLLGIDGLICIGGDDTLSVASAMQQYGNAKVIGVPKTIDNDLMGTDYTFGFWSAVQLASKSIEDLVTTARSHQRIVLVEVMGRNAGWLTLMSGLSSGADIILLPETKFDFQKDVIDVLCRRTILGHFSHIIAVSEGAIPTDESFCQMKTIKKETIENIPKDNFGNPKLAELKFAKLLRHEIEQNDQLKKVFARRDIAVEAREIILGHTMRAGSPNVFDRILGLRLGVKAMKLINKGESGKMVRLEGQNITSCDIVEGAKQRIITPDLAHDLLELKDLVTMVHPISPHFFNTF